MSVSHALPIIRSEISKLRIPQAADKVYKDECMFSFDSPFSDGGLFVNMITFRGYGKDYLDQDIKSTGCKVYVHLKWKQMKKKPVDAADSAPEPTKLAIGVAGGFAAIDEEYDVIKESFLAVYDGTSLISIPLPNSELPEFVSNVAVAIVEHDGMRSNMQVSSWNADNELFVSRYAAGLEQLNPENKRISQDPRQWRDEATGATENLWLNLSTGFIGGGRRNWDGSGGSGSALDHFVDTGSKYPLVVKLGTITAHGADVYSYAADENNMVIDPQLAEHLSFWGIDAMKLQKTDKTMGELDVALNMSYDWSKILQDGEELEVVSGPGLLGLRNLGASCYLNSVMQTLLSIPEVQERYLLSHENIVSTAVGDPSMDFTAQLSKLAVGLLTNRYVPPADLAEQALQTSPNTADEAGGKLDQLEKYVLAPLMFKHLIGAHHSEFSSGRQQDVSEFFQYLLEVMAKSERTNLPRITLPGARTATTAPTASLFEFHVQSRYEAPTGEVKYSARGPASLFNMLDLPVPLSRAVPCTSISSSSSSSSETNSEANTLPLQTAKRARLEGSEEEDTAMETTEQEQFIPFSACLEAYLAAEAVELNHTVCQKTQRFDTFPRYLMVKMGRYYVGDNWVQQKINARIDVPEQLDLSAYRATGLQTTETLMASEVGSSTTSAATATDSSPAATATAAAVAGFQVDEGLVMQLMSMGFSENGCRRAAIATNNADPDTAMNWVFSHMEDSDFNDPPVLPSAGAGAGSASGNDGVSSGAAGRADPEAVSMLTSMGYSEQQVSAALHATTNDIERAADWLFSHAEDLDAAVAEVLSAGAAATTSSDTTARNYPGEDGEGKYALIGIISHLGKSTSHGHYVCHVKKDGQWILFNDEKVGKCTKVPIEYGFMYLYRRIDGPGTFAV